MKLKYTGQRLAALIITLVLFCTIFNSCKNVCITFSDVGNADGNTEIILSPDMEIPAPQKEGYSFGGWYYDAEYKNPFSAADEITEDTTVYAKWQPLPYTVKFVMGEGVMTSDANLLSQTVNYGETAEIPHLFKKDENVAVTGWYLDEELTIKWSPDSAITGDITVYANWGKYYNSVYMNAPRFYIETEGHKKIDSTERYVDCNVNIRNTDVSAITDASARVRGRGNTTWTTISDKKAYRVKFDKKTDLFGMGREKDYVLLSNYRDYTLMRNDLVFRTARKMGLAYTSEAEWVHLYLNGKYEGLYLLCEQTETGENRVNIGKDDADGATERTGEQTGYLLEIDGAGDYGDNQFFKFKPIRTADTTYAWRNHFTVTIKSPGGEYITDEQYDYIKEYMTEVNRSIALRDWKTFCELCDVDSFVYSFIINELSYSVDMGWAFFLYKPAGEKLHYGPVWDYDQGFGSSDLGGITYDSWYSGEENVWFTWLLNSSNFKAEVCRRYNEIYDSVIMGMDDEITAMYDAYIDDINVNYVRWDRAIGYPCWRLPNEIVKLKTYDGNVKYLRTWLQKRINWMTDEINGW